MSSVEKRLLAPALQNILFPTDFSEFSYFALPFLRSLAERYGSTVHIVHVLAPDPALEILPDGVTELESDQDVAQSSMKSLLGSQDLRHIACTSTVERGQLWEVIEALIGEKGIDLVVLRTHGRHGLRKLLHGSVAEQIFRLARVPVLTLGPHATDEGIANNLFGTILFATDFSFGALRALPHALSLARANKSRLVVLHALAASMEVLPNRFTEVEPDTAKFCKEFIADAFADALQQLEELIPDDAIQELKPELIVEYGPPAGTVLKVAKDKQADLIVMGADRAPQGSIVTHMPWTTASDVVCAAHCPVLTVRS